MSTKATLIKARDILAERGVTREGTYISQDGCQVCALGAVQLALGGEITFDGYGGHARISSATGVSFFDSEGDYDEAANTLNRAMVQVREDEDVDYPCSDITDYNDQSESDDQVIAVFDRAIELADDI